MSDLREQVRQDMREIIDDFARMVGKSFAHIEGRQNRTEAILEQSVLQQDDMRSRLKNHEKRIISLETNQTF